MSKVIGSILVVAIVLVGAYVLFGKSKQEPLVSPTPTAAQEPTQAIQSSADPQAVNELRAGGNSFKDPQGVYVFLYPSDYKLDEENGGQHVRVYKTGATQRGQTEMYDGVIVVFETVNLLGQTLNNWIDASIKQATADGTSHVVEPKKAITLNNYPGFTYTLQGLGTAKYYVLQKDAQSNYAVVITTSVQDPEKKNYQKEVDALLATIELLK